MKLYVWHNVFREWEAGVAFALAMSVDDARKLIIERVMSNYVGGPFEHHLSDRLQEAHSDLAQEPEVYETPYGDYLTGSC